MKALNLFEKIVTMKVWLLGDSGTGPGDISPGPFCPISRLLCGHRAGGKPIPHNITWSYCATWPGGKI